MISGYLCFRTISIENKVRMDMSSLLCKSSIVLCNSLNVFVCCIVVCDYVLEVCLS